MIIDTIKRVELEISSDCNAACPGCARTQNLDILQPRNLTIQQIQTWFPDRRHIEDKTFKLCGVLGDPIVNPDCMAITKWLLEHGGRVHYSTNGGRNSADWWHELGRLSGEYGKDVLKVHFCVDGVETNHIYRVNTNYKIIDRNMQAYSDGGHSTGGRAEASWIYIEFDHNSHEVETAKKRAQELDFRFALRTGMRNTFHDWVAKIGKKNNKTEKTITTTGSKEHSKVEVVKELDRFIQSKDKSQEEIESIVSSISCKFYHDREIFVSANSSLWPCCFLWDSAFKNKDGIMDKYSSFTPGWNDLNQHSIDTILATEYYQTTLSDSFDPRHNKHVSRCIRTCAKNRAYHNEIKYA